MHSSACTAREWRRYAVDCPEASTKSPPQRYDQPVTATHRTPAAVPPVGASWRRSPGSGGDVVVAAPGSGVGGPDGRSQRRTARRRGEDLIHHADLHRLVNPAGDPLVLRSQLDLDLRAVGRQPLRRACAGARLKRRPRSWDGVVRRGAKLPGVGQFPRAPGSPDPLTPHRPPRSLTAAAARRRAGTW